MCVCACVRVLKDEAHQARLKELDDITTERDGARTMFEDMRKQRLDEFMAGFSTITSKLKEMYQVGGACLIKPHPLGVHHPQGMLMMTNTAQSLTSDSC